MSRRLLVAAAVISLAACSDGALSPLADDGDPPAPDKSQLMSQILDGPRTPTGLDGPMLSGPESYPPITYEGTLRNGHSQGGSVTWQPWGLEHMAPHMDWWVVPVCAGSTLEIEIHRTSDQMDPDGALYRGIGETGFAWNCVDCTPPELTYLGFWDDEIDPPHGYGGWFYDTRIEYYIGTSGIYSLAVGDALGMGPPDENGEVPYDLLVSGVFDLRNAWDQFFDSQIGQNFPEAAREEVMERLSTNEMLIALFCFMYDEGGGRPPPP